MSLRSYKRKIRYFLRGVEASPDNEAASASPPLPFLHLSIGSNTAPGRPATATRRLVTSRSQPGNRQSSKPPRNDIARPVPILNETVEAKRESENSGTSTSGLLCHQPLARQH